MTGSTLDVTAGTAITDSGVVTVTGVTDLSAVTDITLDSANEFGGAVSASGTTIILNDVNDIELADIDAAGNLAVTAVGSIDDGSPTALDGDVDVGGTSTLISSGGGNITVDDTTNDFVDPVRASGEDIALGDASDIQLADIDATGSL